MEEATELGGGGGVLLSRLRAVSENGYVMFVSSVRHVVWRIFMVLRGAAWE